MDVRNIHVGCFAALYCCMSLRGTWKMRSPRRAEYLLYCGLSAFASPVSKGEPCVMFEG